jgi:hypothetical protein
MMKPSLLRDRQFIGLLYGITAGLAFAVFSWGVDGFGLATSHGAYPWVKFIPSVFLCVLAGGLVGWATIRFENHLLAVLFWSILALFFSRLVVWLPLKVAPYIIRLFDHTLGEYIKYPYYSSLNQNAWFGFAAILIVALICGLLEINMIEQALFSSGSFAILLPLILCIFGFGLVGSSSDSLLNRHIREPIQTVDELIQFALDHVGQEVDGMVARSMHLGAVNTIEDYLPLERRLILGNFDESIGQVDVLVDFSGVWVKCTAIYNQVTFCKLALNIPGVRHINVEKLMAFLPADIKYYDIIALPR